MVYSRSPRGSGGIGRRASLRSWWPKGRRGSSPFFRILSSTSNNEEFDEAPKIQSDTLDIEGTRFPCIRGNFSNELGNCCSRFRKARISKLFSRPRVCAFRFDHRSSCRLRGSQSKKTLNPGMLTFDSIRDLDDESDYRQAADQHIAK
jgi:hypothetical protein